MNKFLRPRAVHSTVKVQIGPHQLCVTFWLVLPLQNTTNIVFKQNEQAEKLFKAVLDIAWSIKWLYSSCWLNLLNPTGHVMHHHFNIQQLYALSTLYLCVLYLSENKQRLVPLTAQTDSFL